MGGTRIHVQLELFPSHARVGAAATLQLRPYRNIAGNRQPARLPARTIFRVTVIPPGETRAAYVRLQRDAENHYVWSGSIRFPWRGKWHLRSGDARLPVAVAGSRVVPSVWESLERPIRIPTIGLDTPCPTSAQDPRGDLSRIGVPGRPAWATGPAYPNFVSKETDRPVLEYAYPIPRTSVFYGSEWSGNKQPWYLDQAAYSGPLLIRGRQLNGMNIVRFGQNFLPERQIRIPAGSDRPNTFPSMTRVRHAGCYGFQVDGTSFSSIIVFQAVPKRQL